MMKLWARIRAWARGLLYSATEYPAISPQAALKVLDEESPVPDWPQKPHVAKERDEAAYAHAKALAAAEAAAERAAPLHRFENGARLVARDGQEYVASNVEKKGWMVSMTLQRLTPKKPKGMSARQWDRLYKQKRRKEKELRARFAVTPDQMRQIEADQAEARRLAGCE